MFEIVWDPGKAAANLRKHGISFADAATALRDPNAYTEPDPRHSAQEDREITIGRAQIGDTIELIVAVVHVQRDEKIRIISARRATPRERDGYHGRR